MEPEWRPYGFDSLVDRVRLSGRRFDYRPGFYVRTGPEALLGGAEVSFRKVTTSRRRGILATPGSRDTPRRIPLVGFAYAPTPTVLQKLGERFGGVFADETRLHRFTWEDLGERRWADVNRLSTSFVRQGSTGFADWTLTLEAPDQAIFGDGLEPPRGGAVWGQTVQIVNRGTHAARVEVTVRGARPAGYTITGPGGARAVVTAPLAAGTPHVYDGDTGVLYIGGLAQELGVTVSDLLEVPHGTHTFSVTAGAEISVSGFDTYIP